MLERENITRMNADLLLKRKEAVLSTIQELSKERELINRKMILVRLQRNGFPMNEINSLSVTYILKHLVKKEELEKTNIGSFYRIKNFHQHDFYHGLEDDYRD